MTAPDTRSQRERMLAGDPYHAHDPELVAAAERAQGLMDAYNTPGTSRSRRQELLCELAGSVGKDVTFRAPLYVDYGTQLSIGDNVFANFGLVALDCAPISIGADTQIGPNVQLLTPTHPVDPAERRTMVEAAGPITIGENVWIGGGAIVLAHVTIGDNAVIGAGAVVTRDVPANAVAVGNPARVVRSL
ncbi:MAG: sugar O-acetyltransferase [Nocardioidaceae bacterium]|nr:sugar O-acetyltransferase [Nocardioidaceae bacterium]